MNAQLQNNRPANPVASFNAFMQKHKSQLELALPKHLNADRMVRLSLTAFSQNPALQRCDPKTIFGSIIVASQLGLEIGVNGQGYLVPYKDKCTFVPGWKGLVDLANRGGRCTVWTGAVYEGDEFDYMLGDSPYCKHKPCGEFEESKLTHVYAIGRVKDSEMPVIEVWPIKKVHAHFKKTVVPALQSNHYSKKHLEAYAKKVALLQVLKYMPQSIEMSNAVDVSYAAEQGKGITIDGDFVSVDNSPQDLQQEQDVQNSTQNEVNHYQEQTSQEVQTFDQEEVVYAPSFEQIKKGILTAKSVVHLEVIEEQALDHADSAERKHLMTLIKAQYQKFQAAEVTAAKKSEPEQAAEPPAEEKPKRVTKSKDVKLIEKFTESLKNCTKDSEFAELRVQVINEDGLNIDQQEDLMRQINARAQEYLVPETEASNAVADGELSVDELKRLQQEAEALVQQKQPASGELRRAYAKALNTAKSLADVLDIEEQIENDGALNQGDAKYLADNIEEVRAKFETSQAPAVDPIKSTSFKNGMLRSINDAQSLDQIAGLAPQITEAKAKLTNEHHQELLHAYAARKAILEDQNDMFNNN